MPARRGDLPPARSSRKRPPAPPLAPAPPPAGTEPPVGPGFAPLPERRFRDLREQSRWGIWDDAQDISYNPWQAMIAMALT